MLKEITEEQFWELYRSEFAISKSPDGQYFHLRDYGDERITFVIPKCLPLYCNGDPLNPATYLEDHAHEIEQLFGIEIPATRIRFMIGTWKLEPDEKGLPRTYFLPAHYLSEVASEHLYVVAEFDRRLNWATHSLRHDDLDSIKGKYVEACLHGGNDDTPIGRVDITFNLNTPECQRWAAQKLQPLAQVVAKSDPIMCDYEQKKSYYRQSFEEVLKAIPAIKEVGEFEFGNDRLYLRRNLSPGHTKTTTWRYHKNALFDFCLLPPNNSLGRDERKLLLDLMEKISTRDDS